MSRAAGVGEANAPNLTKSTVSGLRWTYASSIGVATIQLAYTAIMSRLLSPAAFGLMALATVVVNFGNTFARMGVAQALIQKPEVTREDTRAGFTGGLVLGTTCFLVLWFVAPGLSEVFRTPEVVPLLRATGGTYLLLSIGMTSQGLLRRDLRFRELAIIQVAGFFFGYLVIGLGLALAGAGVWSLVGAVLGQSVIHAFLAYGRARHPLMPTLNVRKFRSLYSFGVRVSIIRMTEFLGKNLDTFAVARYVTPALLGQYNRGFYLVNLPLSQHLSMSLSSVLFPGFSRVQGDRKRLKRAYMSVLSLGGIILYPLCAGLAVAAPETVRVVLGPQWEVAATLVPWFTLAVGLSIMSRFTELVFEARAQLNKALKLQGAYLVVLALLLYTFKGLGVWGFAAALALGEVLRHVAYLALLRSTLDLRAKDIFQAYAPPAFAVLAVAGSVFAVRQLMVASDVATTASFIAQIATGAVSLALAIRFNPMSAVRVELRMRLVAAGIIKSDRPTVAGRIARLLVGART